jgi:DNA-binding transcriptional regulator YiaG
VSADEVTKTRERLKLRQFQFARLIGVQPKTVYRWEKGIHPVSAPHARLIELAAAGHLQAAAS